MRTDDGVIDGDLVVVAAGRRAPLDRWLAGIGARPAAMSEAECGLAYFGRQFRLRPGPLPGPATSRVVVGLDEFTAGIWAGDNGTMQLAIAPLVADHRFRAVRRPEVFTAVLDTIPFYASWLEALEPITDVAVMGGLHNSLRRLVVDGRPVAIGMLTVGDAVCTTNPTFGRGLSLTLRTVVDLADTVAARPTDPWGAAVAMDAAVADHVAPWYADQAATDAARLAMLRHNVFGLPAGPAPASADDEVTFAEVRAAAQTDPVAFRGMLRSMGALGRPSDVYRDHDLVARVRATLARGAPPAMPQPTRDRLEAALAGRKPGRADAALRPGGTQAPSVPNDGTHGA